MSTDATFTPSVPKVASLGPLFIVRWESEQIEMRFNRFAEGRDFNTSAEVAVSYCDGHLIRRRLNLLSSQAHKSLVSVLKGRLGEFDWETMLEQAAVKVLDSYREGEPPIDLADVDDPDPQLFQVEPLLPAHVPTVLAGDGDSGKSLLALYLAVLMAKGGKGAGLNAEPCNVGYLDWEANQDDHRRRLTLIERGLGVSAHSVHIAYRRCAQPLAAMTEELLEWALEKRLAYIIADSIGAAVGGDPREPSPVLDYFRALRQIGLGSLSIHHFTKEGEAYGSVYVRNYARMLFKVKTQREDTGDAIHLALYHDKANDGRRLKPMGFELDFSTPGALHVRKQDVAAVPGLEKTLPLKDRINYALTHSTHPWQPDELAGDLEANEDSIGRTLRRYEGKLFVKMPAGWGGLHHE